MKDQPVTEEKIVIEREMEYQGVPVLHYRIEYPQFSRMDGQGQLNSINRWYHSHGSELQKQYETELYREAVEAYENSLENEYPFHPYDAVSVYELTYNMNGVISLYRDDYIFTGGAHGGTVRHSDTWNAKTGGRIFLSQDPAIQAEILRQVGEEMALQMERGEVGYFEDYPQLISEYYDPESFYLTPDGLVIYYQQYEIGPYAIGIPQFQINL